MDYLQKHEQNPYADLSWNIPEQKAGTVNVIGGNSKSFRIPVKIAESLSAHYPVKTVNLVLPDALKSTVPPLGNFQFISSTESGSFADASELSRAMNSADYNLLIGDLSKNSITVRAVAEACAATERPLLIARDAVDLVAEQASDSLLLNENLIFFASVPQLQKLFHAVYYPKMLLLSQSLVQIADALHKFTLSYPARLITFHSGQILIAENGEIHVVPLEKTPYTVLSFWMGEPIVNVAAMNLYSPGKFIEASIAGIMKNQ